MNITFTLKHLKKDDRIKDYFDSHTEKLSHYLKHYQDDSIYVQGSLDKNPHKNEYYASLRLYMPHISLFAHKTGEDVFGVINEAFGSIVNQVKKHNQKFLRKRREVIKEDNETFP